MLYLLPYLRTVLALRVLFSTAEAFQQTHNIMASSASGLTAGPGSQLHSIQSKAGGGERTYRIHLPHKTSVPTPLILALHGKAQDSSTFESETQLSNPEVNNGSIVVYPQGSKVRWMISPCSGIG